jgi:hypothetical protein
VGKRRRHKNQERKRARGYQTRTVQLWLDHLEVALGYDGFMRGHPDPAIVISAYVVADDQVSCVLRHLARYHLHRRPPATARAFEGARASFAARARADHLIFLAMAVEEDAGTGVQKAVAAAGHADALSLWTYDQTLPNPESLSAAAATLVTRPGPHRVHVLDDGVDVGRSIDKDDWIGASAWAYPWVGGGHGRHRQRVPLRADDDRNDWTLLLEVRLSG